jgi:ankyrin repeat protein
MMRAQSVIRASIALLLAAAPAAPARAQAADGTTPLHMAVRNDEVEAARRLLQSGASVAAANRYGVTPAMLAAANGSAAMLQLLLDAGADANSASKEGETLLMSAARAGSEAAVRQLLARKADPNRKESWLEQTALMWAAADNHAAVAAALIDAGADVNARAKVLTGAPPRPRGSETAFQASHSNFPRGGFTPLLFAAQYGSADVVRVLADRGADLNLPDPDGLTPMMMAIVNGHYDTAAVLLEKGADANRVDKSGRGALYFAVDMNSLEWLFSRPSPRPSGDLTPVDMVKRLLDRGANPNAQIAARPFILHHNATGHPSLVEGTTPFMKAASTSDIVLMRLLIERGANPNLTTKNKTTPLMLAAGLEWRDIASLGTEDESIEAMKICLEHGADVNAVNDLGETALHGAAQRGADRVVQFLADQGATLDAKNKEGRTPMDEAIGQLEETVATARRPVRESTRELLARLMAQRLSRSSSPAR